MIRKLFKKDQAVETKSKTTTVEGQTNDKSHIITFEPRSYSEVQFVADHLKSNRAVVVNLHRLPDNHVRRVKDFLSGVIYSIDGSAQQLGAKMYLFTPDSIGVGQQTGMNEE